MPSGASRIRVVVLIAFCATLASACELRAWRVEPSDAAQACDAGKAGSKSEPHLSLPRALDGGSTANARASALDGSLSPEHRWSTLMTWNLEWFGDPSEGPADEGLQYDGVRAVLAERGRDLVALQEVASESAFDRLLRDLPGYAGALSGYAWTQRTALLWDTSAFELVRSRALSGLEDAGRPPLSVVLRRRADRRELRLLVIHAKAQADAASHDKRAQLASGLRTALADELDAPTIIVGDFNDLLSGSITTGADTPYRPLLDDPRFAAPTLPLCAPGVTESSYAHGRGTIDHALLAPIDAFEVDPDSVDVLQDELLARDPTFSSTVSDHFPVVLALRF